MKFNLARRHVDLFRFTVEDGHGFANIYIEETAQNEGRLIIATHKVVAHRYFDACWPNLRSFLIKHTPESIGLNVGLKGEEEKKHLVFVLSLIWSQLVDQLQEEMRLENKFESDVDHVIDRAETRQVIGEIRNQK